MTAFPSLRFRILILLFLAALAAPAIRADEPKGGPPEFKRLKFRPIGPAAGGRVDRACGVPGDPLTFYAAVSAGGVWKSTDGGVRWKPIFDDQPVSTIGCIAVAASDPNVLYVGSGEGNIRGNVEVGDGIYKSVDAGKTWKHVWKQEGQIGTIIVHPTNPDIAYAAVFGHAFGPNEERGVYRTTDGGASWKRVLFKDKDTGASDVCFDPSSPKVLFAGMWQARRRPWEMTSGGPGSGLYTSRDGGDSWTSAPPPKPEAADADKEPPAGRKRCEGLPEGIWGKICVAVAPSDGRRVYALIEAEKGGLFRSDDGGEKWDLATDNHALRQRAWYFSTLTVHPKNPDVVWFPQVPLLKTIDGGKTLKRVDGTHHGDHHDIWFDPKNPDRIIDSNDGGVDVSVNGGETWYAAPLPIAQFYHVAADNRIPYFVSGCMQDIGSAEGPSNSLKAHGIGLADWFNVGGGEAGFTAPDPSDPDVVFATEYGSYLSRYDHRTRQTKNISIYPYDLSGHGGEDLRYRFQWTAPIVFSPHDPKVIYHGGNVLFQSSDGGQTWKPISGDLTTNDKAKQKWSGGPITGDNTGAEIYCTIFAVAESPKQKELIWTGSDDGLVHVTRDAGKTWADVTPAQSPQFGTVCCIEPSHFDSDTAYVVVDAHRLDVMKPYLFKTTDAGKTWASLSAKLPQDIYLRAVREDPKKKGMLYLATEHGIAFSTDDGATWKDLKLNFPTVAVSDLVVKDDDLVLATSGRSLWIFDDLTPLRDMTPAVVEEDLHLFPARPAYRYRYSGSFEDAAPAGTFDNPPEGAIIHYFLKKKPAAEVVLEILDEKGARVRKLTSKKEEEDKDEDIDEEGDYSEKKKEKKELPTETGLHRVVWDLHYDGAEIVKKVKVDGGEPKVGPLVNPGTYTLKLTADGKTATTQIEIRADPRVKGTAEAELDERLKLALQIRDDFAKATRTIEQLRAVKRELEERNGLLKGDDKAALLVKASKDFVAKLDALESKLHNPKAKVAYDILAQKGGAQLYSQLAGLFETAKEADGPPTQGLREVYAEQAKLLEQYEEEWKSLTERDLEQLNQQAKKQEYPIVIVPSEEKEKDKDEK